MICGFLRLPALVLNQIRIDAQFIRRDRPQYVATLYVAVVETCRHVVVGGVGLGNRHADRLHPVVEFAPADDVVLAQQLVSKLAGPLVTTAANAAMEFDLSQVDMTKVAALFVVFSAGGSGEIKLSANDTVVSSICSNNFYNRCNFHCCPYP